MTTFAAQKDFKDTATETVREAELKKFATTISSLLTGKSIVEQSDDERLFDEQKFRVFVEGKRQTSEFLITNEKLFDAIIPENAAAILGRGTTFTSLKIITLSTFNAWAAFSPEWAAGELAGAMNCFNSSFNSLNKGYVEKDIA